MPHLGLIDTVMASAASENTFRTLAEKPLLATNSFWCGLGVHKWTKYTELSMEPRRAWDIFVQYKTCDCCGKVRQHVVNRS